ncbi:MAG: RnfABCDGE type electron transport complex subunit D [Clostridia bacterium]|nr:RnfABCDGE type electron transport complex subunit D [Clostridia bacterium]
MENKYIVSSSPHLHTSATTSRIMLDVIIALIPTTIVGWLFFGLHSVLVTVTAMAAAVAAERIFDLIMKKPNTCRDLSALLTGLLIGLNMPPSIPIWMVVIGSAFAIIIVKQMFGGLGKNFMNPALGARCFMLIAWTGAMTSFASADAVSSATPLAVMRNQGMENLPTVWQCLIGAKLGTIGEVSALALIAGFIYLLIRKVVSIRIPAAYIISFAVLTFFCGRYAFDVKYLVYQILTGGLLLGAFFMATDYTTSPTTPRGMIIFGIGCGVLTFLIRRFGGYPEGVSFSILLMNLAAPLIERYTIPKSFGNMVKGGARK